MRWLRRSTEGRRQPVPDRRQPEARASTATNQEHSTVEAEMLEDGSLDPDEIDSSTPAWWDEGADDET